MRLKDGVVINGLDMEHMGPVLAVADRIWKKYGREEGATITAGLDGIHMEGSKHYTGNAVDLRNRYFTQEEQEEVFIELIESLDNDVYDLVHHKTHYHIEYDPK